MSAPDFSTVRSLNEEDSKPYKKPIKCGSRFCWFVIYSLRTKMGVLGLAPLHSQKHGYGSRGQRQLRCSCFAEQCRGIVRGCVELVVKETVEEPTSGVRETFLCVFNAVKHDRVWILYVWEDVKFQVTFGMLQLSYYKDFSNKQEKKCFLGCACKYSCLFFWACSVGGEAEAPPGWETPLGNVWRVQSHMWRPHKSPGAGWTVYVWAEAGGITTGGMCFKWTRWSSAKFCSWVILCLAIK